MVIEGFLANQSPVDQDINVRLRLPIYFANSGKGQNMVATQVYGRDGSYFLDGNEGYLRVNGNSRTPVVFVAYCADFDKDNPTKADGFSIAQMPPAIEEVVRSISQVEQGNPQVSLTVAAQLALWVHQGKSLDAINERFQFSEIDVEWMNKILQTTTLSGTREAVDEH